MFTGLVQDLGVVRNVRRDGELVRMSIETALDTAGFEMGESVSVNGICLTVVEIGSDRFAVEMSQETIQRTTFDEVRAGSKVHLERALRLTDRLGGHLVSGHIDGVGTIRKRLDGPRSLEMEIAIPAEMSRYVVEKGSVAVDGVSLTVNVCGDGWFGLTLIPHTLKETILNDKRVGARVNVECDLLGKYVERLLRKDEGEQKPAGGVTMETLAEHGFL